MALLKTLTIPNINMFGLKVIVLLAVVSLTSACLGKPKTDCMCHKKGSIVTLPSPGLPVPGPIEKKHDGFSWVCLGRLLSGIGDKVKDSKSIFNYIIHLKVASAVEDVLSVVVSLSKALGSIIDVLMPGVGALLGRLVISIVRIIICIVGKVGSPGLLGGLLGIKKCPSHAMCGPDYGCKWGWKRYDGKWDCHQNLLRHYDAENPIVQLDLLFKKYSNGHGDASLNLVTRILYDHIFILGKLSVKSYSNWCKDDIISVYICVVTIYGLIGNSCKPGLGLQLVDELESFCYTHFKNSGYKDIKVYNSEIKKKIENVKCWRWRGVIISEEAKKSSASEDCNYDSIDESEDSRRSTRTSEDENRSNKSTETESQRTKSKQSSDYSSDISETRSEKETTKRSSEEDRSEQAQRTRSQQSRDSSSDISQNQSDRESTKRSSGERSDQSSTKSRATDCNQSSEISNESQSGTDKSSDDSQRCRDTSDSSSVNTGKRGRIITEVISGSEKETKECSKKESSDTSNRELDQTKIDLKDGTITATKVVQTKKSSKTEEKSAASSEKQYSAKRTVVDNC